MFATLFVVCNLELGLCKSYTPEYLFTDKEICDQYSDGMRQQALLQLPRTAVIMYECVQFPSPV